jgi:hypothetical protein
METILTAKYIAVIGSLFLISLISFCYVGGQDSISTLISVPILGVVAEIYVHFFGHIGTGKVANFVYASMGAQVICIWVSMLLIPYHLTITAFKRSIVKQQPPQ